MLGRASGADTVVIPGNATADELDLSGDILINSKPLIQAGTASTSSTAYNESISFSPAFSSAPIITATGFNNTYVNTEQHYCNIRSVSATSAMIRVVDRDGNGAYNQAFHWIATQRTQ